MWRQNAAGVSGVTRRRVAVVMLAALIVAAALYWAGEVRQRMASPAVAGWSSGVEGDAALLARLVFGEANQEPYVGQVAVASVVLNRVDSPGFPDSIAGVVFQPGAFESVDNGLIWSTAPSETNIAAAVAALNGWDPTYGALFFWNPYKPVNPWVWTKQIVTQIGDHVFAR